MLKEAANLLKNDGILVYSTCSISPMENEENVKAVINDKELGLQLIDPPKQFQYPNFKYASPGISSILKENANKVLRFDPALNPESIGFFIAKFKKVASKE